MVFCTANITINYCYIPKSMRKRLVVVAHDPSGHPTVEEMILNILQDFWFIKMQGYVHQHVKMCFECLTIKTSRGRQPGKLHPIQIGKRSYDTVHLDHVEAFTYDLQWT